MQRFHRGKPPNLESPRGGIPAAALPRHVHEERNGRSSRRRHGREGVQHCPLAHVRALHNGAVSSMRRHPREAVIPFFRKTIGAQTSRSKALRTTSASSIARIKNRAKEKIAAGEASPIDLHDTLDSKKKEEEEDEYEPAPWVPAASILPRYSGRCPRTCSRRSSTRTRPS